MNQIKIGKFIAECRKHLKCPNCNEKSWCKKVLSK
jgi:hypothetical protein